MSEKYSLIDLDVIIWTLIRNEFIIERFAFTYFVYSIARSEIPCTYLDEEVQERHKIRENSQLLFTTLRVADF